MDWEFCRDILLPALNKGLIRSIWIILPSASIGLVLGVVTGALRAYGPPYLRRPATWYATLFRGTPLVVQLVIIYYGLPNLKIYLSPYMAAVVGFILCSGAYHSEYIRGGLLSIKVGQIKAAQSLGFSNWQATVWIIVPQALRRALPGCGNEIVYLIKYSSLAYIVTFYELTGQARSVATMYFRFTEAYFAAGLYYLGLVTVATFFLQRVEKRLYIPGFGRAR